VGFRRETGRSISPAGIDAAGLGTDPSAIGTLFREGKYSYTDSIVRSPCSEEKAKLQIELLKVQNWVKMTGQKMVVIFEGRDSSGKGEL
jgi:polyphosphate kinase 2 (PPK2 family)